MASDLAALQAELSRLQGELKDWETEYETILLNLNDEPGNATFLELKQELEDAMEAPKAQIAEVKAAIQALDSNAAQRSSTKSVSSSHAEQPKWSHENHPALKKAAAPVEEKEKEPDQVITYKVNDTVMAKWMGGDKGFYPARITSVTGSSLAPIYTVKFRDYKDVETLRGNQIRPVAAQKRKADGISGDSGNGNSGNGSSSNSTAHGTNNGVVLSAAADLYPKAQLAKAGADGNGDDKPRHKAKKIKANKELEAGKNKWQEFTAKGKVGKAVKKESMFRTPEGFKGRVGFTGSGQAMRKDPTRSRHVYQPNEELD